jgi:prepilin-type N-terminal cleavage/methylation domain-containing protein
MPMISTNRRRCLADRSRGFTLVELLVSLAAMVVVILAVLQLFDMSNKIARVQTQVAEMQQSLRIGQYDMVRLIRATGRGQLLRFGNLPQGVAVAVSNNVAASTHIAVANNATPLVRENTDVLTVRGVFSTPIYQINYGSTGMFTLHDEDDAGNPVPQPQVSETGTVQVCETAPSGLAQDLAPFRDLIASATGTPVHEAIVLSSPVDDNIYAVVEFEPENSLNTSTLCVPSDNTKGVTLAFHIVSVDGGGGTQRSDLYRQLGNPGGGENMHSGLTSVAFLGIVEEYRFYLRDDTAELIGGTAADAAPRLSRARFFPNTELAYAGANDNLRVDIADNFTDFQVALAIDRDGDGIIVDDGGDDDDWLYNNEGDDDSAAGNWIDKRVFYVRLSSMVRTDRRDPSYSAPLLTRIEDRLYASGDPENAPFNRMFRRRALQTTVDLRNLS